MGPLTVEQSKKLLQRVLDDNLKLKDIKKEISSCPQADLKDPNVQLTFLRLRKQKVNINHYCNA